MGLFRLSLCVKMGYSPNIFLLMPKTIWDVDALAFISAHELNTGLTMGIVQKNAVNNRYKRYKNIIPTPNGSNLWTIFNAQIVKPRIWIHCPVNDSTANAAAYNVEFISKSVLGTFNNFVAGNFTPQGVIGGATKFFDSGIAPNQFPQTSVGIGVYCRTNANVASLECGAGGSCYIFTRTSGNLNFRINDNTSNLLAVADSLGLIQIQRNGSSKQSYKKGILHQSVTVAATTHLNTNIFFHANNSSGSPSSESSKQLSGYFAGLPLLTANEISDMNWIEDLYNTEVITGGRQV